MNESRVQKAKNASAKGFANENRLLAALLERGYNASHVVLPHSSYDIVVEIESDKSRSGIDIIRVQVKTVSSGGSISFVGGTRGGVDREYISDEKEYTQNTKTSDIVVGVKSTRNNGDTQIDFYFVPTIYIEDLGQKSISINKLPKEVCNGWEILEKCKSAGYVSRVFGIDS